MDIENSIRALEDSTAAVEQQCATLDAQLEAMRKIRERNNLPMSSDSHVSGHWQSRQRDVDTQTARIEDSLQARVADLTRQTDGSLASLNTASQRQLDKDDRLLDGLQKLMLNLDPPNLENKQIAEVESLSRALVSLQSTVIKKRANRTYVSAMEQAEITSEHAELDLHHKVEADALAAELDSLISEVDSVLDMVVDFEYRRPILHTLKRCDLLAQQQRHQWLAYVQTTLQQMTSRLHDISCHTQDLGSYSIALATISMTLKNMVVKHQPTKPVRPDISTRPQHKSVRDLVLPVSAPRHPAYDFLRHHGIQLATPSLQDPETRCSVEAAIKERKSRLEGLSAATEQGIAGQISESVDGADAQLEGLLQAVYAYSPYKTVNLADAGNKARLEQLDKDTEVLAGDLRGFELGKLVEREKMLIGELLGNEENL